MAYAPEMLGWAPGWGELLILSCGAFVLLAVVIAVVVVIAVTRKRK